MKSISKMAHISKRANIEAAEHAVIIHGSADYYQKVNTDGLRSNDTADGHIKGLSRNALARLRDCIARTAHISGNYRVCGCCLTIPWGSKEESPSNPTQEEASLIWREFVHHIGRLLDYLKIGIIYRVELQARRAVHWHLMVYMPEYDEDTADELYNAYMNKIIEQTRQHRKVADFLGAFLPRKRRTKRPMIDCGECHSMHYQALYLIRMQWLLANIRAHKIITERRAGGRCASASSAPIAPPADIKTLKFCFDSIPLEGVKSGVAYLASHTTKHKQDQLGYTGKQWGTLGGKWLHQPDTLTLDADMSIPIRVAAYRLLRRWIQRNRTASDYRVCIPRRRLYDDTPVYSGLVVRNQKQLYLFGTPREVVARAFECAALGLYVHSRTD